MTSRIHPCLWFQGQAEEAVRFYLSVFPNSRLGETTRYGPAMPMPEGSVLTIEFELDGQPFTALNGDAPFAFTPALSLVVPCDTQGECDRYMDALSAQPEHEQCGWLVDRYGVSWQITPRPLMEMLKHPDAARRNRMLQAMMPMKRLDIAALQRAFDGRPADNTKEPR